MSKYKKQTYEQLAPTLQTGDILLFSGKGFASNMIKLGTWSRFSHIGMVWVAATGYDNECWESTSLNKGQCGVQTSPLYERLRDYNGRVWVRRLHVNRGDRFYHRMDEYRDRIEGTLYEKDAMELIGAAMPWRNMVDWTTIFCSEKEGGCFKYLDFVDGDKQANEYTPADFSSKRGDVDRRMHKMTSAWLETEIEFDLKAMI